MSYQNPLAFHWNRKMFHWRLDVVKAVWKSGGIVRIVWVVEKGLFMRTVRLRRAGLVVDWCLILISTQEGKEGLIWNCGRGSKRTGGIGK